MISARRVCASTCTRAAAISAAISVIVVVMFDAQEVLGFGQRDRLARRSVEKNGGHVLISSCPGRARMRAQRDCDPLKAGRAGVRVSEWTLTRFACVNARTLRCARDTMARM